MRSPKLGLFATLAIGSILLPAAAPGQAILGTAGSGSQAIVFPSPNTGLPTPVQNPVPGLPVGAQPHGVAYFGSNNALVSDAGNSRIFVIQISTATLLDTINVGSVYTAGGTITVAPGLSHALGMGGSSTLAVIAAPFVAGATVTPVALPGSVAFYQTQAIVFNAAGRAFVSHTTGISVLDPPYSSVAFTIPFGNTSSGALAISPDGNKLLATTLGPNTVSIFTAPYSAGSLPDTLPIPGSSGGLDGIFTSPDGTKALVVSAFATELWAISAPFSSSSTVEAIPLNPVFGGHEDVGISADSQLAILTGQAQGGGATAFVQAPFTTAGATVFNVTVAGGRGAGAVRFLPPGLAPGLTISKSAPASVPSGSNLTYTITYGNTGTAAATGVIITDPVPAGTTFVSATGGGVFAAGVVTWNIGTIPAGTTGLTVSFTVNVTATSGTIDNVNYTIEGAGIPPIPGPPVSTTVGGGGPTPTVTPPFPTPTPIPGQQAEVPMLSWPMLALLAAGIAFVAVYLLARRS